MKSKLDFLLTCFLQYLKLQYCGLFQEFKVVFKVFPIAVLLHDTIQTEASLRFVCDDGDASLSDDASEFPAEITGLFSRDQAVAAVQLKCNPVVPVQQVYLLSLCSAVKIEGIPIGRVSEIHRNDIGDLVIIKGHPAHICLFKYGIEFSGFCYCPVFSSQRSLLE